MDAKSFLTSKTLWANVLALALIIAQVFGIVPAVIDPEKQAGLLAILNLILRLVTKQPITLGK